VIILYKFILYGFIGQLIEVWFTGIYNILFTRNPRATSTTYLWMHPIYGLAAVVLGYIHSISSFNNVCNAIMYVPIIFIFEFVSGFILYKILNCRVWDYSNTRWNVLGLIRLDYAGFWFVAALIFEYIEPIITSIIVDNA